MELSVDQILQKGIAAHNQGNLEDAERFYRDVLRFHPAHPDANHNLGVLAYSSNEVKAALVFFNAALKSDPTVEQFWVSYINVLIAERYIDDAKLALRRAESKEVSEDKLNSLSQKLDLAEAEKVSSSTPSVIQKQALISLFQNEKHDKTEKLAISLTQKFPEDPLAWKVLGAVLGAGNKFAEGLIATRNAISLNKKDPEAFNNLGIILKELGDLSEAEHSCRKAIALMPEFAEAHFTLGTVLKDLGRIEESHVSYENAIKYKKDFNKALIGLGRLLLTMGSHRKGLEKLRLGHGSVFFDTVEGVIIK